MSLVVQRVAFFFFLFAVFYLPFLLSHGDRVLSEWVISNCSNFYETNPLGLWPETLVIAFDFLVGGLGVIGFLFSDRLPTLSAALILVWAVLVFVFGVVLHANIVKLSYAGCMWYGGGG